jgi:hypothetical protein
MTATKETHMTTQISTKLAALAVALMMNSLLIGGVAYVFNAQVHQHSAITSLAQATPTTSRGSV